MVVALYIYVDGISKRIELFDDEKISVNSSIQNINDISKVFTDYSNSFTIPASDTNNEIFNHWYENALDNGFDQRLRYDGYIEIDTQTFRVGKWQLESATIKNNRVEDYKITFYGNLKSLTDKFGEDKLKDIAELNDYTIAYTGANVQSSITTTGNPNVIFPLISSDRSWQYTGGGSNDISTSGGAINYSELFPSLKVARVFDAIESKYGVTFDGTFLTQDKFTKAYLYLKNSDTINVRTDKKLITLTNFSNSVNLFKIESNTFKLLSLANSSVSGGFFYTRNNPYFTLDITFPFSLTYTLSVYKNGALYTTINNTGTTLSYLVNASTGLGDYQFYIQSNVATTYTYTYEGRYFVKTTAVGVLTGTTVNTLVTSGSGGSSLIANLDLTSNMPDMKVSDFVSGILKMFNLTAFSLDGVNFTFEQLENWYYLGGIKDFSEYTITDNEFTRVKPYKKINFEYEKSESLLNRNFSNSNLREYGDLSYTFNNDGSDYTIKLPFENLMFNKFTGTFLQVGYCLNESLNKYIPKPVILYKYGNYGCSFYMNNGVTTNLISTYNVMGQDLFDGEFNSLNWGVEISSFLLNPVYNSLFSNYYLAYLNNLYSLKSRMVKVKMRLPYLELLNLRLNDRIVIRDKRYIINQFTTDLTTFESDFELIQDFRTIDFDNTTLRQTDNTDKTISVYTTSVEPLTWVISSDDDSMIIDVTNFDDKVNIKIDVNTSGLPKIASIVSDKGDTIIIEQDA